MTGPESGLLPVLCRPTASSPRAQQRRLAAGRSQVPATIQSAREPVAQVEPVERLRGELLVSSRLAREALKAIGHRETGWATAVRSLAAVATRGAELATQDAETVPGSANEA